MGAAGVTAGVVCTRVAERRVKGHVVGLYSCGTAVLKYLGTIFV